MKTITTNKVARLAGLTAALALFAGATGTLAAGEIFTGKGGATLLLELNKGPTPYKAHVSAPKPMSCATCKEEIVQVTNVEHKGSALSVGAPTKSVLRHACSACRVTWTTVGHGKAKTEKATHACASCAA
jgi:hypothetical protein